MIRLRWLISDAVLWSRRVTKWLGACGPMGVALMSDPPGVQD
jgi:hypothetical protein